MECPEIALWQRVPGWDALTFSKGSALPLGENLYLCDDCHNTHSNNYKKNEGKFVWQYCSLGFKEK
jgi:hypothetical protein